MSNKIKTFVANYLSTFLEGVFVEAAGDIKHYAKEKSFSGSSSERRSKELFDLSKSEDPKISADAQARISKRVANTPPELTPMPGTSVNKPAQLSYQNKVVSKGDRLATSQAATKEKGIETRNKEDLAYKYPTGRETRKARYDAKRQSFLRRDREGPGPASFERNKQIEVPGKEQHPASGLDAHSVERDPLPARASVASKYGRSANTGAVRVKSQSTKWEPEKKQGPYIVTAPGVSSLHPEFQPAIRRDTPALSHVADKVAHALKRAKLHQNK